MIISIRKFFRTYVKTSPDKPGKVSGHSLQLATAALLIEMMRADAKTSDNERQTIMKAIHSKFKLTGEETKALLQMAEEKIWKSSGYYEFTHLINQGFTYEQKVKIIEHLWEVAFADRELDKHEEHMVRKIADLLYVSHEDFINTKLRVRKKKGLKAKSIRSS